MIGALLDDATAAATIAGQLVLMVFMLLYTGPWSAAVTKLFPTATATPALAIGFNVSVAIFGGTAPLVATLLIKITGDNQAPAFYLIGASALILAVLAPTPPRPAAPTSAERRRGKSAPWAQALPAGGPGSAPRAALEHARLVRPRVNARR